jgi:hypothetical protein
MPIGQVSDVLPDPVLTALAVELGTGGPYASAQIAPTARVANDEFKYAKFGREDVKDDGKTKGAPGQPASEVGFGITYQTGSVQYHKLKSRIPDAIRANDVNGTIDKRRTRMLTNKLLLGAEKRIKDLCHAAAKTRAAPGTKWDAANPTIRNNILDAREIFRKNAGMYPNVMVLPPIVRTVVFSDSGILDLIKYTDPQFLAKGQVPTVENMVVVSPGAIEDTSNPGATQNIADVWSDDEVYYLYVDPQAGDDLEALTALRQVRSMATGGTGLYIKAYREPDESAEADWLSAHLNQTELVIADELILRQLDVLT